jgi:hypothetical protein
MAGRSISGRETFARNDESGRVRASIEEKLANNVERKQTPLWKALVSKAEDTEDNGEQEKSENL